MTRKYTAALSVHAKLLNLEGLSLLGTISTCNGGKYPTKYLY